MKVLLNVQLIALLSIAGMKSAAVVCVLAGSASAYTMTPTMGLRSFAKRVLFGGGKQDFLEASPYHDQSNVPVNTFKAKVRELAGTGGKSSS